MWLRPARDVVSSALTTETDERADTLDV